MRDERLSLFVPQPSRLKTYTKRAVLWLYSYRLLSLQMTQRTIDLLRLRDA